jgi:hypothetical protein
MKLSGLDVVALLTVFATVFAAVVAALATVFAALPIVLPALVARLEFELTVTFVEPPQPANKTIGTITANPDKNDLLITIPPNLFKTQNARAEFYICTGEGQCWLGYIVSKAG